MSSVSFVLASPGRVVRPGIHHPCRVFGWVLPGASLRSSWVCPHAWLFSLSPEGRSKEEPFPSSDDF